MRLWHTGFSGRYFIIFKGGYRSLILFPRTELHLNLTRRIVKAVRITFINSNRDLIRDINDYGY